MAVKFTYLLGAGASAEALPLIKGIKGGRPGLPEAIREFLNINKVNLQMDASGTHVWDVLMDIAIQCKHFGTPDLYAKFLIETGDDQRYKLLIRLLSNYFLYYQRDHNAGAAMVEGKFDRRALNFLTVISKDKKLPENVKLLSWNYDMQIEMAAERLRPVRSSAESKIKNFSCWPNVCDGEDIREKDPFLFHLNGVAGFDYSARTLANKRGDALDFGELDTESLLSFAWEEEEGFGKRTFLGGRLRLAQRLCTGTNILVIIGYSFPFFNRRIDDVMFQAMKGTLDKIYYQDPRLDGGQLIAQFDLSDSFRSKIVHIPNTDNYHIPYEL